MNIPSNQKGFGHDQLKQDSNLALMDKAIQQMDGNGNGLVHMINHSPSNAVVDEGHPTLGNVVDTKA